MFIINFIRKNSDTNKADKILENARIDAEKIKKEYIAEAKAETNELKIKVDEEIKERKEEIKESEKRLLTREENIDRRDENLQKRENLLAEKEQNLLDKQNDIQEQEANVERIKEEQLAILEKISGYTKEKARELVMKKVEDSMTLEIASYIKEKEAEAKLEVDKKSKSMLVESMQKYASDVVEEQTITVVDLPNDEMKGRIIGREGRNIRTIEQLTGVDLIIDDTPEVISVSCFDPIRRETARIALENLIKDGRIQPGRIEEVVEKAKEEVNESIIKAGEDAIFQLGISRMSNEMIQTIGKLKYRTSYGQNALKHSMEVAYLTGIMAVELGLDQNLGRRAGLLHDIGKALDFEVEGSHVELGARLAKKNNENSIVINAIESHHGDVEATNVYSHLVSAADTLSAARPGARSETLENYIKRVEKLEELSTSFEGVSQAYAIQAGREVRVMVMPEKVDDLQAFKIARELKEKIENELTYPGQIKVTVIRETRANEVAK